MLPPIAASTPSWMIWWAAMAIACKPEEQKRLMVVPGTVTGRPARTRAMRARWLVDPLAILGHLGEGVDALLRDGEPVTEADLLPMRLRSSATSSMTRCGMRNSCRGSSGSISVPFGRTYLKASPLARPRAGWNHAMTSFEKPV
jgi:hypothetical protein